ncbi:YihY/virulence factor BrkB family protein [Phytohabitans suffuscus]|uniref:Membrane protein n=1 Tax=Phytohabitans suffuscus TaxID=624315 RepID=A0A6F8YGW3_9ACTN|nr:YihY/virulence factor BrkB family protein [Phytohabitans suffuscus]BCB85307.1 membrane protein [Phytohabitans suffuscus]
MNIVARLESGISGGLDAARRRSRAFDHLYRALDRYGAVLAGRLAAAIAYYGFFAVFALGLVAYWAFGFVLNRSEPLRRAVDDFLNQNLPFLQLQQIQESSGTIGVVGLLTLVFTGIGWVEAIRSSQRALYGVPQQPGNLVVRRVFDMAVLVAVFALLAISVAAADAIKAFLRWLVGQEGSLVLTIVGWGLTVVFNMVLAAALLVVIPRLRMPLRRLYPSVLLVAIGITILNTAGREYVIRVDRNPAYTVVTGAVGLLLYLYLLNQLLLLGAALAATSTHGEVTDLAEGDASEGDAGDPPEANLSENKDPRRPDTSS